jgi:hypothetical protein
MKNNTESRDEFKVMALATALFSFLNDERKTAESQKQNDETLEAA